VDTDFRFFMRAERMRKRSDGSYELVLVLKPHTPEQIQEMFNKY